MRSKWEHRRMDLQRNKANLLLLRARADGIQLAMGSADTWQPVFNELGDARAIQYKDKDYLVNRMNQLPVEFWSIGGKGSTTVREEVMELKGKTQGLFAFKSSGWGWLGDKGIR